MRWPAGLGVPSVSLAAVRPPPSPREVPGRMTGEGHPRSPRGPVPDRAMGSPRAGGLLIMEGR